MRLPVNNHPDVICPECGDLWEWVAVYSDERVLFECPRDGGQHRAFSDIDLARLQALVWQPRRQGLPQVVVEMSRPYPEMQPVLFRRRSVALSLSEGSSANRQTIHCLGWQRTDQVNGAPHVVESFAFAFEDGSLLVTDDRNAV
jgi:hypothetical protein